MKTKLEFHLVLNTVPVTLHIDGNPHSYELREMSAAVRDRYLDKMGTRVRMDETGKPVGVSRFDGMQAELLSLCLWDNEQSALVSHETLQGWPASVVSALYAEAQEMHKLPRADEAEVKNA